MKACKNHLPLTVCFWSSLVFCGLLDAGIIRDAIVHEDRMTRVNLKLGQSTVLRFPSAPKKIILGNSNYIRAEFVERDLTLQALAPIETNLFVYTQGLTYGFLLKAKNYGAYDDLVNVASPAKRRPKILRYEKRIKKRPVNVGEELLMRITTVKVLRKKLVHLIDGSIENKTGKLISLREAKVFLSRKNRSLSGQSFAFDRDFLKPFSSARFRVAVSLKEKGALSVNFEHGSKKARVILKGRDL